MLVPLMARLFRVLLSESKVPACWKVAKLSPIHKKWEVLNPGNFRMIAVSGVIYRIFANVLKDFEINAFLNQDSYRLLKFVSDLVSIFDTG